MTCRVAAGVCLAMCLGVSINGILQLLICHTLSGLGCLLADCCRSVLNGCLTCKLILVPIPSNPSWSQAKEDFDKEAKRAKKKAASKKQDKQPKDLKMQERRLDNDVQRKASGNIM